MTIKQLKSLIADLPDHYEIYYEYDGPDATTQIEAKMILISREDETITLSNE